MNQLIAIALGGASGAVVRFFSIDRHLSMAGAGDFHTAHCSQYHRLVLARTLNRGANPATHRHRDRYRAAILVGFIGAFTTSPRFRWKPYTL